jgi:hypothetical protein
MSFNALRFVSKSPAISIALNMSDHAANDIHRIVFSAITISTSDFNRYIVQHAEAHVPSISIVISSSMQ